MNSTNMKIKINIVDVFMFLNVLLIGADIFVFKVAWVTIRFVQISIIIQFLLMMFKNQMSFKKSVTIFIFIIVSVIATVCSYAFTESSLYLFWLIYNVVFVTYLFYSYLKFYGIKRFSKIFETTLIIISILTILQFSIETFLKIKIPFLSIQYHLGISRPALWFYEPSYLATYLLMGLGYFIFKWIIQFEKKYLKHTLLILIACASTTSTVAFLGIIICFMLILGIKLFRIRSFSRKISIILGSVVVFCVMFLGIKMFFPSIFNVFIMRVFNDGLVNSSGDRIKSYAETIAVFLKFPIFGVGPDAYGAYLGNRDIVPNNISLELLANVGILGFISFYAICIVLFLKVIKSKDSNLKPYAIALLVLMIILQANQNYMRLYIWMLFGVLLAIPNKMILINNEQERLHIESDQTASKQE